MGARVCFLQQPRVNPATVIQEQIREMLESRISNDTSVNSTIPQQDRSGYVTVRTQLFILLMSAFRTNASMNPFLLAVLFANNYLLSIFDYAIAPLNVLKFKNNNIFNDLKLKAEKEADGIY